MRMLKQSTAANVMVFMTDSADHVAGKAGLTLTITASKDGAAFGSISPTVTERGNGWYNIALTTSHADTLGDLALHVTGAAADPSDLACRIVAGALDGDISNVQSRLPAALVSGRIDASVGAMAANVITAAAINAAAITAAKFATDAIDAAALAASAVTEIQSGLALSTQVDALEADSATLLARLTSGRASNLDNLDLAVSVLAAYVDTEVGAIKTKTDSLTFTVAGVVDANIQRVNDVVVNGTGAPGTEWGP